MSGANNQSVLARLVAAIDDEEIDDAEAAEFVDGLDINVAAWAKSVAERIAAVDRMDRELRFQKAASDLDRESARYTGIGSGPVLSIEENRALLRTLLNQLPKPTIASSVHFHKFEEATAEELAEMVRAARYLLQKRNE